MQCSSHETDKVKIMITDKYLGTRCFTRKLHKTVLLSPVLPLRFCLEASAEIKLLTCQKIYNYLLSHPPCPEDFLF